MEDKRDKTIEEIENEEALKWAHFLYSVYKKRKTESTIKNLT